VSSPSAIGVIQAVGVATHCGDGVDAVVEALRSAETPTSVSASASADALLKAAQADLGADGAIEVLARWPGLPVSSEATTLPGGDSAGLDAILRATQAMKGSGRPPMIVGAVHAAGSNASTRLPSGYLAPEQAPLCAPFDIRRQGAHLGAGAVLLQVAHRDAPNPLLEILGTAAVDREEPGVALDPDGFQQLLTEALSDAGIEARDVGVVHAASVGHPVADHSEAVAVLKVLSSGPLVFSTRWVTGDLLSASPLVGIAVLSRALRSKVLYGPRSFGIDLTCPVRVPAPDGSPVEGDVAVILSGAQGGRYRALVVRGGGAPRDGVLDASAQTDDSEE
jgi:3-oxoacyl-(acyl-carrier-protein) synthase